MAASAGRAANLQIEKVPLHALGGAGGRVRTPPGRGMPSEAGDPAASQRRSLSVSFRRTHARSDGGPDIDAGARRVGLRA